MCKWRGGLNNNSGRGEKAQKEKSNKKGAFVGGTWMDLEECATHFSISNGSGCPGCVPPPRSRSHKSTPSGTYNVIVIGAGAIGCSIARELSKTNARVLLLDAAGLRVTTKYPLWVLSKLPKGGPPTHPIWTEAVREKTTHPPHYPTRARGAGVRARDVTIIYMTHDF